MTNLSTLKIARVVFAAFVVLALSFSLAAPASAAVNLTFLTVDGATNATVEQGDTVEAKVTHDITSSTDVESMSWELVGSGLPQTCVNTVDRIADGTFTTSFDIDTTGASEGTWDVRIRAYGDDGADASNLCEATDQVDSQSFNDRITVVDDIDDNQNGSNDNDNGNGSGSNSTGNGNSNVNEVPAWFTLWLNGGFKTVIESLLPKPLCAEFKTLMVGQSYGSHSAGALQTFLITKGGQSGVITYGATGYYGPQTSQAVTNFQLANSCN